MKKLLALVLCMMLIVSVIPTSAFAQEEVAIPAIDLKPAYDAMTVLNNAFAQLAGLTVFDNAINGAVGIGQALIDAAKKNESITIDGLGNVIDVLLNYDNQQTAEFVRQFIASSGDGWSPEMLFSFFGPFIAMACNYIGEGVVADCEFIEDAITLSAQVAYDAIVDAVTENTADVIEQFVPEVV